MLAKLVILGALAALIALPAVQAYPADGPETPCSYDTPKPYWPRELDNVAELPKPSVCSFLEPQPIADEAVELPALSCVQVYPWSALCSIV